MISGLGEFGYLSFALKTYLIPFAYSAKDQRRKPQQLQIQEWLEST